MARSAFQLLLFVLFVGVPQISAAFGALNQASTEQVTATLLASHDSVRPGDEIWLGLHQKIIPHWHTYWLNPGDSGTATQIEWTLPTGVTVGDIHWPAPAKHQLGTITNYGYSDQVMLLVPLRIPVNMPVAQPLTINALAKWLVCEETCLPQSETLSLSLSVVAKGESVGRQNPLIAQAIAQLPKQSLWPLKATLLDGVVELRLQEAATQLQSATEVFFYADTWGRVVHGAEQPLRVEGNDVLLTLRHGDNPLRAGEILSGVLVVTEGSGNNKVSTSFSVASPVTVAETSFGTLESLLALVTAAGLALLGGIILNLMPCVFPVLSIKAISLLKHSNFSVRQKRLHGFAYTGGVLISFTALAAVLILLKAAGTHIGWGFQYQSPVFVFLVALLMFAVGLSLSGVVTLGASMVGIGSSLVERSGYVSSFFTGVLAAIVATPCTAPFMGAAIGYALSQPALHMLVVFWSLGLGLALPYLLLTWWPLLQRRLPKPGIWMEWLKQTMAFPMYFAAVWLVWVLGQQANSDGIAYTLASMVIIALAAWIYQITRTRKSTVIHAGNVAASLLVLVAVVGGYGGVQSSASTSEALANTSTEKHWEAYSAEKLQALRAEGKPVFLNFTAAWCISCLVNERVALSQTSVKDVFAQHNITYLKGDWTNQDKEISAKLAEFGRSGVPLYVFYQAGVESKPEVLPQILTPDIVISAVQSTLVSTLNVP